MSCCLNCGGPRGLATACQFCGTAYPASDAALHARLEESTAWLKAPPGEDGDMLAMIAMEIDDAIDAGSDDHAITLVGAASRSTRWHVSSAAGSDVRWSIGNVR